MKRRLADAILDNAAPKDLLSKEWRGPVRSETQSPICVSNSRWASGGDKKLDIQAFTTAVNSMRRLVIIDLGLQAATKDATSPLQNYREAQREPTE